MEKILNCDYIIVAHFLGGISILTTLHYKTNSTWSKNNNKTLVTLFYHLENDNKDRREDDQSHGDHGRNIILNR